jgi:hypothetical protein
LFHSNGSVHLAFPVAPFQVAMVQHCLGDIGKQIQLLVWQIFILPKEQSQIGGFIVKITLPFP